MNLPVMLIIHRVFDYLQYLWHLKCYLKCLSRYMRNKKVAAVVSSSKMISKVRTFRINQR